MRLYSSEINPIINYLIIHPFTFLSISHTNLFWVIFFFNKTKSTISQSLAYNKPSQEQTNNYYN